MNLYHVENKRQTGWDTTIGFVCNAKNAEAARKLCNSCIYFDGEAEITYIGKAKSRAKEGIILESFNAG